MKRIYVDIPVTPQERETTNNERFNQLLNSCRNPRQVMAALKMLAADKE